MAIAEATRRSPDVATPDRRPQQQRPSIARRMSGGTRPTRTRVLQRLPDATLRQLAASSMGLGAGFYLAGAPRLIVAIGIAPALLMGAAIALRPILSMSWPTGTSMIRLRDRPV